MSKIENENLPKPYDKLILQLKKMNLGEKLDFKGLTSIPEFQTYILEMARYEEAQNKEKERKNRFQQTFF